MNSTVSILAFNRLDLTKKCVESVLRSGGFAKLILTDNGSTDGTRGYFDGLAVNNDRIVVVRNSENLGFIDPNRHALSLTASEFFVCLNNDCVVPNGWIEELESPMRGNQTAALCGPEECASRLLENGTGHRCEVRKMEYLEGSTLLCRTLLMKRHGLFSDYLKFAYCEDADLSLRLRSLGYSLHTVPIKVQHEGGATSDLVPGIRAIEDANKEQMRKHWGPYLRTRTHDFSFVVRRIGALGDALLASPVVDALARRFPKASIRVETGTPDLFIHHPNVEAVSRDPFPRTKEQVLINLDMAYENRPGTHIVDAYALAAEGATQVELNVKRETSLYFQTDPYPGMFGEDWVAIHAEPTTWPGKNWPFDRWAELIEWLRANGRKVLLVGAARMAMLPCDLDLRGQTSPLDLAAAIARCWNFIGHDSFPLHVAQSQGVPVIGLFGATRGRYILTDGSPSIAVEGEAPCAGERHRVAGVTYVACGGECMLAITVDQVKDVVTKMRVLKWMKERGEGNTLFSGGCAEFESA